MDKTIGDEIGQGCAALKETTSDLREPVETLDRQIDELSSRMGEIADGLSEFGHTTRHLRQVQETPNTGRSGPVASDD